MIRIAIDAMGGDRAPMVNIEGAIALAKEAKYFGIKEIVLVGQESILKDAIPSYSLNGCELKIHDAKEIIATEETPATAVRKKPCSSIVVTIQLIKEGRVDAAVSAGHTGAIMAAALMKLGRISGVIRPAIPTLIPNLKGRSILIDVGANVDCKPKHLAQFAIMGNVYAHHILGIQKPRVGILSIGHERNKGNELTSKTYSLLEGAPLEFVGNVEGRDITNGEVDVIVCDGFIGNALLKFGESLAEMILSELKEEISRRWWLMFGGLLCRPAFRNLKRRVDYSEYGGAPLLGANGVVIICHGGSSSKAIKNGIKVAAEFVRHEVNRHIESSMMAFGDGEMK
jgi:glycerol-3-phosphate acyltransferase PlsX